MRTTKLCRLLSMVLMGLRITPVPVAICSLVEKHLEFITDLLIHRVADQVRVMGSIRRCNPMLVAICSLVKKHLDFVTDLFVGQVRLLDTSVISDERRQRKGPLGLSCTKGSSQPADDLLRCKS
eukprot:scaffold247076_cov19-Tisochrysis_lutea.AAC.1